jgi:hypothetical protein
LRACGGPTKSPRASPLLGCDAQPAGQWRPGPRDKYDDHHRPGLGHLDSCVGPRPRHHQFDHTGPGNYSARVDCARHHRAHQHDAREWSSARNGRAELHFHDRHDPNPYLNSHRSIHGHRPGDKRAGHDDSFEHRCSRPQAEQAHTPLDRGIATGHPRRSAGLGLPGLGHRTLASFGAALGGLADAFATRGLLPRLGHLGGVLRLGSSRPVKAQKPSKIEDSRCPSGARERILDPQ